MFFWKYFIFFVIALRITDVFKRAEKKKLLWKTPKDKREKLQLYQEEKKIHHDMNSNGI